MRLLYEQMSSPKYVSRWDRARSGADHSRRATTSNGVDFVIPVDIYIPGCPPRPESLFDGLLTLMERNAKGEPTAAERWALESTRDGGPHRDAPADRGP